MTDTAIEVEGLSKLYHIGRARPAHDTVRDRIAAAGARLTNLGRRAAAPAAREPATDLWALRDVSFAIERGAVVGLIGRNGAGKSTLLKILSRITEPTRGRATVHGRVGSLLEVGTGFHPDLTGRENIYLNGAILGMRRREIDRTFDEIVAFSEIERFLDTPVKRYSSGMYVRLAFAVAAHLEPEILLVDEVLAVGDAAFQKKCLGKMGDVTQGGRTVLFVSHNLYAVQTICETTIWLEGGRIQASGATDAVAARYRQETVRFNGGEREPADKDSAEAHIVGLRVNGQESRYLSVNGAFTLRMEWDLEVRVPLVLAFGVSLSRTDGAYVCGLGTHLEGHTYAAAPGCYTVGAELPDLTLASGTYVVRVSVMEAGGNHAYCYRSPAATLYVETPFTFDGLLELEHGWEIPGTLAPITAPQGG